LQNRLRDAETHRDELLRSRTNNSNNNMQSENVPKNSINQFMEQNIEQHEDVVTDDLAILDVSFLFFSLFLSIKMTFSLKCLFLFSFIYLFKVQE